MKRWAIASLTIGLSACTPAVSQSVAPTAPAAPVPVLMTGEASPYQTRRLTLRLTLSSPEDLLAREGDRVEQGQTLSDRVRDRQRLEAQKQRLVIQQERLQQPISGPPPTRSIPEVATLPPPSFLTQVAEVERMRLKVEQVQRNVEQQQRKLDLLSSMPRRDLPESTIPHETELLAQRQRELDQAEADYQLAQSKLSQAQTDRQYQEYLHSLEMSKRAIAIQQQELQRQEQLQNQQAQERDRSFQLAQLEAQLQQIETQLFTLSAVRSPYSGTVQRIKWEGQNDQNLVVELTLVLASTATSSGDPPTAAPESE